MFYKDMNITGNVALPGANQQVGCRGPFLHFPYSSSSLPLSKRTRDSPDWSEFHLLGNGQMTAEKYSHLFSISVRLVFQLTSYSWERRKERRGYRQGTRKRECAGTLRLLVHFSHINPHTNRRCLERCTPSPHTCTHTSPLLKGPRRAHSNQQSRLGQQIRTWTKERVNPACKSLAASKCSNMHVCMLLYSHLRVCSKVFSADHIHSMDHLDLNSYINLALSYGTLYNSILYNSTYYFSTYLKYKYINDDYNKL